MLSKDKKGDNILLLLKRVKKKVGNPVSFSNFLLSKKKQRRSFLQKEMDFEKRSSKKGYYCLGNSAYTPIKEAKTFRLLNKKWGSSWLFKDSNFAVSSLRNHQISQRIQINTSSHNTNKSILTQYKQTELFSTTLQTSLKCATARPSVIDSEGPSSIIKDPNIRSFVAKSVLARFTRFLGVRTQPLTLKAQTKHCQIGQLHY